MRSIRVLLLIVFVGAVCGCKPDPTEKLIKPASRIVILYQDTSGPTPGLKGYEVTDAKALADLANAMASDTATLSANERAGSTMKFHLLCLDQQGRLIGKLKLLHVERVNVMEYEGPSPHMTATVDQAIQSGTAKPMTVAQMQADAAVVMAAGQATLVGP